CGRTRKSAGGTGTGNGMGKTIARTRHGGDRTRAERKATPAHVERGRERENSFAGLRSARSLDGTNHHGSRSQRAFAESSGRSADYRQSPRTARSYHLALARWHAHGTRSLFAAHEASWPAHRRRYDRPASPPGRSLPRRRYRRHSQSAGTAHSQRRTFHLASCWQSASLSQHSALRTAGGATHGGSGTDSQGRGDPRPLPFHHSSLAE